MSLRKLAVIVCTAGLAAVAVASEDAPPEHVKWMKDLGAQMGAIRKGADVEKNATDMQATLKQVATLISTSLAPVSIGNLCFIVFSQYLSKMAIPRNKVCRVKKFNFSYVFIILGIGSRMWSHWLCCIHQY